MCSKPIYTGPKVNDTQSFIQKAQFVHGDTYGYDKSNYVGAKSRITITCPYHGDFEQRSDNHLSGKGCRECRDDSKRSNSDEFIEQAKLLHGDKYFYEKVEYINNKTKISINCKTHGDFEQSPCSHLSGYGCPSCKNDSLPGRYDFNKEEYKDKNAILYHVRFTDKETGDSFEKIGVTKKSVTRRFYQINKDHDLKLEVINEYPTTLYEAIEIEAEIKQHLLDNDLAFRVHTLKQYPGVGGWTECFRCGDLDGILDSLHFS